MDGDELGSLMDAALAERTNLREGLREMHRVRFIAYLAFTAVIVLTGPVLQIDPLEFTLQGLWVIVFVRPNSIYLARHPM